MSRKSINRRGAQTAAARRAQLARFAALVDPDGTMPPTERTKAAARAKSQHYQQMAAKSAVARRRNAAEREAAIAAGLAELAAQRAADAAQRAAALRGDAA